MELGAVMKRRRIRGHVQWAPRTTNQEADCLANGRPSGFDPSKRLRFNLGDYRGEVFQDALQLGAELKRSRGQGLTRATARGAVKRHKKAPLKEREPW